MLDKLSYRCRRVLTFNFKTALPLARQVSSRRIRILKKTIILAMQGSKSYLVIFPVARNPKSFNRIFFVFRTNMLIIHRKINQQCVMGCAPIQSHRNILHHDPFFTIMDDQVK